MALLAPQSGCLCFSGPFDEQSWAERLKSKWSLQQVALLFCWRQPSSSAFSPSASSSALLKGKMALSALAKLATDDALRWVVVVALAASVSTLGS